MNKNTALRAIFFALITILVACGGGGGGGGGQNVAGAPTQPPPPTAPDTPQVDGGMGGTGGVSGAVQDFGSIFVNDIEMITDTASISVEGNTASEGALAAGQQVAIIGDLDTRIAETVDYRANVKGTVDSISSRDIDLGEASLNVLGQMVRTSAATRYVNGGLGGLAVGQILEVSGFVSSDGEILATYIEVHDSLDMFKVVGVVSANGSGGFRLNQLQVDSSQALLQGFGDTVLADGLRVEVRAQRSAFTSGSVVAEAIELLEQRSFDEGAELDIEGFINRFGSSESFMLLQLGVTTDTNTQYLNGDASSLAVNVKVQVEGAINADGELLATRVIIQPIDLVRAEGTVQSVNVSGATLTVLGVTFAVRPQTELRDKSDADIEPFTLLDINIGDYVEVRGYVDAAAVVASSIEREDADERERLRGPVTAENASTGEFSILSVAITGVVGITEYEDVNELPITQTQFHDQLNLGDFVKATWDDFISTSEIVDSVEFESPD